MGGELTISSHHCPAVFQNFNLRAASVNHRLDCNRHSRRKFRRLLAVVEVRNLRFLMHRPSDTMANKLANHTVSTAFNMTLDRPRYIHDPVSVHRLGNSQIQSLLRDIHQPLRLNIASTYRHRPSRIANKSVVENTDIQAYDVTEFQSNVCGQPMHYLFVYRQAHMTRILSITQESAFCPVAGYSAGGKLVQLPRGQSRLNESTDFI